MFSREATNNNFLVFGLTRLGLEPMIYHIRGEHANHMFLFVSYVLNNTLWQFVFFKVCWTSGNEPAFK